MMFLSQKNGRLTVFIYAGNKNRDAGRKQGNTP